MKQILLILCLFLNMSAFADIKINGISYSLDMGTRTAAVTGSTLEHVVVPETIVNDGITYMVTSIAKRAFYGNNTIKSIKTGNTIKKIETGNSTDYYRYISGDTYSQGSFDGATNLEEADFGDNLEEIGAGAFYGATRLKKIQVGKKLTKIENSAFKGCVNLKYIVLPATISSITRNLSVPYNKYESFYGITQLLIICLKQGFDTGYPSQTIYPRPVG